MTLLAVQTRLFSISPANLLRLQEAVPRLEVKYVREDTITPGMMADCEIILGTPPVELLTHARALKWLHTTNSGAEPYNDLRVYAHTGVTLTNASGVYGVSIAEHGVGMMLALSRQFPYYVRNAGQHIWQRRDDVKELFESTAAVFGLGDLGLNVAKRVKALGCKVLGVRNNVFEKPAVVDELFPPHQKPLVLPRADYIVSCLPKTKETMHVFDEEAFSIIKPGAVFVNLGRGNAVDEAALCRALASGRLFGAGLDVTEPEPPAPDSPLWEMENVLITAHSSAASEHVDRRSLDLFMDILVRYESGKRLHNVVDFFRGY